MLGIVIANWNGEKLLEQCLKSLVTQSYRDFKIYVVDNGSVDNSLDMISNFSDVLGIEVISLKENTGFAKANNIGIDAAINDNCKFILTLNNDTELKTDTLEKAMKFIEDNKNKYSVYQLFMLNYFDRDFADATGMYWDNRLLPTQLGYKVKVDEIKDIKLEIKGACAGAAIYSADALNKVRLNNGDIFDSSFFAYYEDVDLAIRLYNAGFRCSLIETSIVYHVHSATGNKTNGFKEYYLNRNMLLYTKRNQSEKEYSKNMIIYYKIIIANLVKNINNKDIFSSLVKALEDGHKMKKKLSFKDGK